MVTRDAGNSFVFTRWLSGVAVFTTVLWMSPARGQLPPRPEADTPVRPKGPVLLAAERFKDLGTVLEGEVLTITWNLENRGRDELRIDRTNTSCGCTVVALSEAQKRIAPGGSLALTASFDSTGRRGEQSKTVTVFSNDPTEPELKLDFRVMVEPLFNINPPGLINLRMVRRGDAIQKTVEVLPAEGRSKVEIQEIVPEPGAPLVFAYEPFSAGQSTGQRIQLTVAEDVPLGPLTAQARVRFTVDGLSREYLIAMRGEVVGDLIWRPSLLDMTRQAVTPGRTLSPVMIESTAATPFEIVEASAGPYFDVDIDRTKEAKRTVTLMLRGDAPPGPFATTLNVRTDSLDQPLVAVPVFGIVADPVEVDPPLVLLRADGTKVGAHRRLKLRAQQPTTLLRATTIACDNPFVKAEVDEAETNRRKNTLVLDITLLDGAAKGRHDATLTIGTGMADVGEIHIPIVVDVPG